MDWQLVIVALMVLVAALYLGRRSWRTWRVSKSGCAGSCGCASKAKPAESNGQATLIPSEQLTLRRREPGGGG